MAAQTGELTHRSGDTTTSDHIVCYSIYLFAFSLLRLLPRRSDFSDALTLSLLIVTGQELFFIVTDNPNQFLRVRILPILQFGLRGLSKQGQTYGHLSNLQRGVCDGVLGLRL